ncbi:hypothetical protein ACFWIB_43000, partial [Streptomyces sp. NPDC127051]|uniref:hypothetical protein n=1 Tax=Streptomyces sp. NPDC127051 TaxID=3347119 RepID=UPI003661D3C9
MSPPQHLIVVSPPGSGTVLLHEITTALGYTSRGTMSPSTDTPAQTGPGEVYPLLEAAYGPDRAAALLQAHHHHQDTGPLQDAYTTALQLLWRVWWKRLGQPVTTHTPLDSTVESRLTAQKDATLLRLLPGRDAWYVTGLDPAHVDGGLLRHWAATGQPAILYHHREPHDRVLAVVQHLTRDDKNVGTIPGHLIYRDILTALPGTDERLSLALTDPDFPGNEEARHTGWLTHHPAVHTITHEELAGPHHGGSTDARTRALQQLAIWLNTAHNAATELPDPPASLPGLT